MGYIFQPRCGFKAFTFIHIHSSVQLVSRKKHTREKNLKKQNKTKQKKTELVCGQNKHH